MFKQLAAGFALMTSVIAFSQVGIDTETPQATLDVVGKPSDASSLDGIIAPRLTGAELRSKTYTSSQTGALVYVTEADTLPAGQTVDVTAIGYYYFNGTRWIKAGAGDMVNIYNSDGTLTGNRIVNTNSNTLTFTGNGNHVMIANNGTGGRITATGTGRGSLAVTGGNSIVDVYADNNNTGQIVARGTGSTGLLIRTQPATPILFSTTDIERMRISPIGNVGINTSVNITEKFHTNGNVRLQGLPSNGAANAIFTLPGGGASSSQDQTFTATRTIVADANGVLGYVNNLPLNNWYNTATHAPATTNTQNIYQMGKIGIMTNNPEAVFHAYNNSVTTNPFTVESDNAGSAIGNDTYFYGYGTSLTPGLFFMSARGSKSSPAVLQNGDLMGEYNFGGYLNSGWNYTLTSVRSSYDGNGTTTDSSLDFLTSGLGRMKIAANGNIAIGSGAPRAKVHIQTGDVYIEQVGSGIIIKSPNGNCWRITVTNTGTFASAAITCP